MVMPHFSVASDLTYTNEIDEFYTARAGEPLWLDKNKIAKNGRQLFEILQHAWKNGMNPKQYKVREIAEILENQSFSGALSPNDALMLELFLTDGYIGYVTDISGIRVNPAQMNLREKDWRRKISIQHALEHLRTHHNNIGEFLKAQEPQTHTYQRLKKELVSLVAQKAEHNASAYPPIKFDGLIHPGQVNANISALRARLNIVSPSTQERQLLNTYDPVLVEAVKAFQTKSGLNADGIIGKQTLHALNQGVDDKIKQLIVNMERLRWIADEKPDRFIVVNVPSSTLWAVENGAVKYEMPVVVGRKKRETLSFISTIHGVRFNPTWTVPPTIKEKDILPELIKDPSYLAGKGIELYDGYEKDSQTLDPYAIDWKNITKKELHALRFVQVPGGHNPLGRIRILMPNEYNIYLHDTNDKAMLFRIDRALSSGCVRMKEPEKMAMFVLEKRNGWSREKMDAALHSQKMTDIYTPERMPVYMLYYTVWLGEFNQVVYGRDIYDWDDPLYSTLKSLDGIPVLEDNI